MPVNESWLAHLNMSRNLELRDSFLLASRNRDPAEIAENFLLLQEEGWKYWCQVRTSPHTRREAYLRCVIRHRAESTTSLVAVSLSPHDSIKREPVLSSVADRKFRRVISVSLEDIMTLTDAEHEMMYDLRHLVCLRGRDIRAWALYHHPCMVRLAQALTKEERIYRIAPSSGAFKTVPNCLTSPHSIRAALSAVTVATSGGLAPGQGASHTAGR